MFSLFEALNELRVSLKVLFFELSLRISMFESRLLRFEGFDG
jgi:hypothetical protein